MSLFFEALTAEAACAALAAAGLALRPSEVSVERREERWLARLPGQRLAWFAASANGRTALATERRVLRLLAERCRFAAPRVLYESPPGDFEVRGIVTGSADPAMTYARVRSDPCAAARLGAGVGAMLAEQHSKISAADVDWLPARPSWPEPSAWITERLPSVVADAELRARALDVIAAYEDQPVAPHDRVLAHTDLGVHNLVVEPDSLAVLGLFDYDSASCADRHYDFRYLVLDFDDKDPFDAAVAAYEPLTGRTIERRRVLLYNAASAISYLAFRAGHAPDEPWCGRTLAQDLQWSSRAIERVLASRRA